MKYQLNKPKRRDITDLIWAVFTLAIIILVVRYGSDIISYIAGHNILKGNY